MQTIVLSSPAKLNLFLAITGRRPDGFHDLVSVVAPVTFGDTLAVTARSAGAGFGLTCDSADLAVDESNLVLRAARAFAAASGWRGGAEFVLTKRIPMGAGLGGGSSNATAALRALNELAGHPLDTNRLSAVAAEIGSDCPLFLRAGPVVMRGRGERLETLPDGAAARLRGRRVLICKPPFGVNTGWAYGRMAAGAPGTYLASGDAEARVAEWVAGTAPAEALLYNNMEAVAFAKFVALPVLLAWLRERFGLDGRMSGSGSACFAMLPDNWDALEAVKGFLREAWGPDAWVVATEIAG